MVKIYEISATLRSGTTIVFDVTKYTITQDKSTRALVSFKWETPADTEDQHYRVLLHLDLAYVVAIVVQ